MDVSIPKDIIFLALMGPDWRISLPIIERSASRMAAYTGTDLPLQLYKKACVNAMQARCSFILFLVADEELRNELVTGNFPLPDPVLNTIQMRVCALDEYKAGRLFRDMYESVIDPWIRHENNSPMDLVKNFEQLYVVS
jgi:hypothetical protein